MQMTAQIGDQEVRVPGWLWGSIGALLLLLVGGLGTWAGATLFDHEKRITATESRQDGTERSVSRIEAVVDRLDEKLDRVLERLTK